jgi:hypothetical protein
VWAFHLLYVDDQSSFLDAQVTRFTRVSREPAQEIPSFLAQIQTVQKLVAEHEAPRADKVPVIRARPYHAIPQ